MDIKEEILNCKGSSATEPITRDSVGFSLTGDFQAKAQQESAELGLEDLHLQEGA